MQQQVTKIRRKLGKEKADSRRSKTINKLTLFQFRTKFQKFRKSCPPPILISIMCKAKGQRRLENRYNWMHNAYAMCLCVNSCAQWIYSYSVVLCAFNMSLLPIIVVDL